MSSLDTGLDLVTGAFSYTGSCIAQRLLESGRRVRTLTYHPERPHPLQGHVEALPYRFENQVALAESFKDVTTFYNTYWVRFDHGDVSHRNAIENSRALFCAARHAHVARVVHISIANPSLASTLPYYSGKALVELALAETGIPYSIIRPTLVFGGDRDVLVNNIAWILRRMPLFMLPGSGNYPVQPVHVEDLADLCARSAHIPGNAITDAAGPETMSFDQIVRHIRHAVQARSPIMHLPPAAMTVAAHALGLLVKDVVLTRDEISGLTSGLLVS